MSMAEGGAAIFEPSVTCINNVKQICVLNSLVQQEIARGGAVTSPWQNSSASVHGEYSKVIWTL